MSYLEQIDRTRIPQHVAIIMDGNGRWAKKQGKMRVFGHRKGAEMAHTIADVADQLGVKYLTMYAFSLENWNRPKEEVDALMNILVDMIVKETPELMRRNARLLMIGDISRLPEKARSKFLESVELTSKNTGSNLIFALSYSSRWEITESHKRIAQMVADGKIKPEDVTEELVSANLNTGLLGIPDPDLLIRTSGEYRISNYLLWQIAYSEMYFTQCNWPEFEPEEFYKAIVDYQHRERRFGKTSEQVQA